jgi:hypothetical protein
VIQPTPFLTTIIVKKAIQAEKIMLKIAMNNLTVSINKVL